MEHIMFEMVAYYAPQIMETVLYALAIVLAIAASKYIKPLLKNKVVEVLANNAVLFVEQTYKDLHGADKLVKALESLSDALARYKIKVTAAEMKQMIEAAVAKFNNVFAGQTDTITE